MAKTVAEQTEIEEVTERESMNIQQRMLSVMRNVPRITPKRVKGLQYSVITHDAVTSAVRPHLLDAGVYVRSTLIDRRQEGNRTSVRVAVDFVNADNPGDFVRIEMEGDGVDNQDKGVGKAVSYAVKLALLKGLCLQTGTDSDLSVNTRYMTTDEAAKTTGSYLKEINEKIEWIAREHGVPISKVRKDARGLTASKIGKLEWDKMDSAMLTSVLDMLEVIHEDYQFQKENSE